MAFPQRNTPVPRMTLATQAALIIRDEYIARARAEAAALDNDALLGQRARTLVAETAAFFTEARRSRIICRTPKPCRARR